MSHPARDQRRGIDGKASAAGRGLAALRIPTTAVEAA